MSDLNFELKSEHELILSDVAEIFRGSFLHPKKKI